MEKRVLDSRGLTKKSANVKPFAGRRGGDSTCENERSVGEPGVLARSSE
jgi:hypothetical protein